MTEVLGMLGGGLSSSPPRAPRRPAAVLSFRAMVQRLPSHLLILSSHIDNLHIQNAIFVNAHVLETISKSKVYLKIK